jgi:hypothetical protein
MRKNIANWAHLIRDVALAVAAILKAVELIVEIVNKIANCNVRKLQIQISESRKNYLCAH